MVNNEFWYEEVGSRAEGRNKATTESKRWWLPSPQVPKAGLSDTGRKKLLNKGKTVHQIFKAAKSINEHVLLDMPVPPIIRDALPKSGKENLGEDLYKILAVESGSLEDLVSSLGLESEHSALEAINRLEAAVFVWKGRITEKVSSKSPVRTSWSFSKDSKLSSGRPSSYSTEQNRFYRRSNADISRRYKSSVWKGRRAFDSRSVFARSKQLSFQDTD